MTKDVREKLLERLDDYIDSLQEQIQKWQEDFTVNPKQALIWSGNVLHSACYLDEVKQFRSLIYGFDVLTEEQCLDIIAGMQRDALDNARRNAIPYSSSPMANLVRQHEVHAKVWMIEIAKRIMA